MFLRIRILIIFFMTGLFIACTPYHATQEKKVEDQKKHYEIQCSYDITLSKVERPADAKERYGKQKITSFKEGNTTKYRYEDNLINIVWLPTSDKFIFKLKNKTDHSIKIIWDEAAYIDTNSISHRVIHSGTKYTDKNNPQPPSVVARNTSINEMILPADHIKWGYGSWSTNPILPNTAFTTTTSKEQFKSICKKYMGKNIQVLLPIKVKKITNEYYFTFEIKNFEMQLVKNPIFRY